jgi:hypothetical protein
MVRFTVLACVVLPLVPVIVSVEPPVDAVLVVEMLRLEEPETLMEVGLNCPVAPLGNPLTVRFTAPAKQPTAPTFAV